MEQGQLNWIANFIWGIADDVLRDLYVRGKYRDVWWATPYVGQEYFEHSRVDTDAARDSSRHRNTAASADSWLVRAGSGALNGQRVS